MIGTMRDPYRKDVRGVVIAAVKVSSENDVTLVRDILEAEFSDCQVMYIEDASSVTEATPTAVEYPASVKVGDQVYVATMTGVGPQASHQPQAPPAGSVDPEHVSQALLLVENLGFHIARERVRRSLTMRDIAHEMDVGLGSVGRLLRGADCRTAVVIKALKWLYIFGDAS